jgi:hypothetical protein
VNVSSLKVGDKIDYRDAVRMIWFKGSVMEIEEGKDDKLIYIEFARHHQDLQGFDIF